MQCINNTYILFITRLGTKNHARISKIEKPIRTPKITGKEEKGVSETEII